MYLAQMKCLTLKIAIPVTNINPPLEELSSRPIQL